MISVYVPDWLTDHRYKDLAWLPKRADRLVVAFGLPHADGIRLPRWSAGLRHVLKSASANNKEVYLSFGGWGGSDQEHNELLRSWAMAANAPRVFAGHVIESIKQF